VDREPFMQALGWVSQPSALRERLLHSVAPAIRNPLLGETDMPETRLPRQAAATAPGRERGRG
jgi:hypothetical protein